MEVRAFALEFPFGSAVELQLSLGRLAGTRAPQEKRFFLVGVGCFVGFGFGKGRLGIVAISTVNEEGIVDFCVLNVGILYFLRLIVRGKVREGGGVIVVFLALVGVVVIGWQEIVEFLG